LSVARATPPPRGRIVTPAAYGHMGRKPPVPCDEPENGDQQLKF